MHEVGRYEMLREIGRGGMATVYLARQPELDRLAALKELGALRAADDGLRSRFLREARMAGSLSHPNVVTVYDYFEDDGTPYIAMEYVEGGSLRPLVGRGGLTLAQVGGVLEGLLAGLEPAGRRGIVHRDLKPENVLITSEGGVKITDFGIGKASDQVLTATSLTTAGTTMGTPAYMAPEQALGEDVTPRTDLYAVGVIAFELLVGHAPFVAAETPMAILLHHVNDPVPPIESLRPEVPQPVADWVAALLVKDAEARPQTAAAAWEQLDDILHEVSGPRWRKAAALPVAAAAAAVPVAAAAGGTMRSGRVITPRTRRAPTRPPTTRTLPWLEEEPTVPPRWAPAGSGESGAAVVVAPGAAGTGAVAAGAGAGAGGVAGAGAGALAAGGAAGGDAAGAGVVGTGAGDGRHGRRAGAPRSWSRLVLVAFAVLVVIAALAAAARQGGSAGSGGGIAPARVQEAPAGAGAAGAGRPASGSGSSGAGAPASGGGSDGAGAPASGGGSDGAGAPASGGGSDGAGAPASGGGSDAAGGPASGSGSSGAGRSAAASGSGGGAGASDSPSSPSSSSSSSGAGRPAASPTAPLAGENADDGGDDGGTGGGGGGENADDGGDGP